MKIIFMGTPDFAVPCLERIIADGHEVPLVLTQPDKPKGRGHKLAFSPVKECAKTHGIEVYQPVKLRDGEALERLRLLEADVFAVVAYGKLLPEEILCLPELGCINVHASLLPKYRGAAPIQWSVINGEKTTGVTTMYMEKGLDTGDMLLKSETEIGPEDTSESLHDRLSLMGAELLSETLRRLELGELRPEKQDDSLTCYAPMIDKETARLNFSRPAEELSNLVRGMYSFPMARTTLNGSLLKVIRAYAGGDVDARPGTVASVSPEGICVACGTGSLVITRLQIAGGKQLSAGEFLKGHQIPVGMQLGMEEPNV